MKRAVGHRAWWLLPAVALVLGACSGTEKHLDDKLEWTSFEDVQATFPIADKPIFLYISQNNCQWCQKMETEILTRPEVAWYLNEHFRFVNINVDEDLPVVIRGKEYDRAAFWDLFNIEGLPAYFCFDRRGQVNGVHFGTPDLRTFKQFLVYVNTGQFGKTPWLQWVKRPEAQLDTLYGIF